VSTGKPTTIYKANLSYDAAQTRRALAILTYTLRAVIPSRDTQSTFSHTDSLADRIALLGKGFVACAKIVECIEATQRADLLAVAIHLYGDVLADETPDVDYVGQTLPVLKLLVDQIMSVGSQVPGMGTATSDRVVHGLLSACLANVDDMR
jgi:hypothetical protein